SRGDFRPRAISLNPHWENPDIQGQPAARENLKHVAHGRSRRTGDQHQTSRKFRQRFLSRQFKVSQLGKLLTKLAKRQLQGADAFRLDLVDNELVFSVRRIDLDSPAGDDFESVLKLILQSLSGRFPNDGRELSVLVFQTRVEVPGGGRSEIGDLS